MCGVSLFLFTLCYHSMHHYGGYHLGECCEQDCVFQLCLLKYMYEEKRCGLTHTYQICLSVISILGMEEGENVLHFPIKLTIHMVAMVIILGEY